MTSKKSVNVIFTVYADIFLGLFDLHSVEFGKDGVAGDGDMGADGCNKLLTNCNSGSSDGKIVDLAANENFMALKGSAIEIALVGSGSEANAVDKDIIGKFLEQFAGFWMTL